MRTLPWIGRRRTELSNYSADVFSIWVSKKSRKSTRDGEPITVRYWEGCWDIPDAAREPDDTRRRPQVTASSTISAEDAEEKCRQKVLQFWLERGQGIRDEQSSKRPAALTREQRRAAYTVKTFLEEYVRSKTNPNTDPQNRWAENTAGRNETMLKKWIYPFLGETLLTSVTHEQVRVHFTETLPNVLDDNDERLLGDRRIRGIYSVFRAGLNRAGAKGLMEAGEFLDIGIRMSFEPAGLRVEVALGYKRFVLVVPHGNTLLLEPSCRKPCRKCGAMPRFAPSLRGSC